MHFNLWTVLIVVAIIALFGGGYGGWYGPSYQPYRTHGFGIGGLLVVILLILLATGRL